MANNDVPPTSKGLAAARWLIGAKERYRSSRRLNRKAPTLKEAATVRTTWRTGLRRDEEARQQKIRIFTSSPQILAATPATDHHHPLLYMQKNATKSPSPNGSVWIKISYNPGGNTSPFSVLVDSKDPQNNSLMIHHHHRDNELMRSHRHLCHHSNHPLFAMMAQTIR